MIKGKSYQDYLGFLRFADQASVTKGEGNLGGFNVNYLKANEPQIYQWRDLRHIQKLGRTT